MQRMDCVKESAPATRYAPGVPSTCVKCVALIFINFLLVVIRRKKRGVAKTYVRENAERTSYVRLVLKTCPQTTV